MAALSYHEQEDIENTKRIRGILKELPPFCTDFFRGIEPRTSARTRLAYAYDLKTFFDFLKQANPELKSKELRDLPLSLLDEIKLMDLEEYMEYLKCYSTEKREDLMNTERGIMRKVRSKAFTTIFTGPSGFRIIPLLFCSFPRFMKKKLYASMLTRWRVSWMRLRMANV